MRRVAFLQRRHHAVEACELPLVASQEPHHDEQRGPALHVPAAQTRVPKAGDESLQVGGGDGYRRL